MSSSPDTQRAEVVANLTIFLAEEPDLIFGNKGRFAIYRRQRRVAIVDSFGDALTWVRDNGGFPASIQEIGAKPVWLPPYICPA